MADETTIDWQDVAKKCWLGCSVSGAGPHAVTFRCGRQFVVVLFEAFGQAVALRDLPCTTAPICTTAHGYVKLAPQAKPARRRFRVRWKLDDE